MLNCNDFYSLSALSLYEGELIGTVNKLYFDKKLTKLVEVELLSNEGAFLTLPVKNIYHVGKNALTVKNNMAVSLKVEDCAFFPCPIGSKAYSIQGEFLGIIKEITFDEKFKTDKIYLDNNSNLDINSIASCGKNTIIFYTNTEKVNVKKFFPAKTPKTFKEKPVQIANILPVETSPYVEPVEKPTQTQNTEFLIGRVCGKDIYNFNNELLIKAGANITKKILKEINRFGKLRELMLYCK